MANNNYYTKTVPQKINNALEDVRDPALVYAYLMSEDKLNETWNLLLDFNFKANGYINNTHLTQTFINALIQSDNSFYGELSGPTFTFTDDTNSDSIITNDEYSNPLTVIVNVPNTVPIGARYHLIANQLLLTDSFGTIDQNAKDNGILMQIESPQGVVITVQGLFKQGLINSQTNTASIVVSPHISSTISCTGATNKIGFYDNGNGTVTSLTFFVSINGVIDTVVCNGTDPSVNDTTQVQGNSPDGLLTTYLKTREELNVSGDVWDDIIISNPSTTNDLRLSIWIEGTDANIWSSYDDSLNLNPPIETNPTYSTNIGENKQGFQVCLCKAATLISCDGASNGVFWSNTSNYFMKEYIEGTVTFTMEFNGVSISDQAMVESQSYPGYFMQTAIDWYNSNNGTSLNISTDGLVYYITGAVPENTIRIKFYTDGEALFETTEEDVGNSTYQELDGRVGFQVCIAGAGG